jgi:hypothetical protein
MFVWPSFISRNRTQMIGSDLFLLSRSHRQGVVRAKICCRMPIQGRQGEAQAGYPRCPRHDDPDNHANASARGRPAGLQHVAGGSWSGQLQRYRRPERPDPGASRSYRAPAEESRAIPPGRHQAAQGRPALRAARYRKDTPGSRRGKQSRDELFEG